jgi:hypothetical protein
VLAFDVFTLTTTMTAPFGLTVAPLAGGTFLRSENGLFLRYTSSVYRFQRDGVASLNNLVGLATGAPSASAFCNDDLILSAKNIDAPGFYYIVLSDLSNGKPKALLLQGAEVSPFYGFPGPQSTKISSTTCIFSFWNDIQGWQFATYSSVNSAPRGSG